MTDFGGKIFCKKCNAHMDPRALNDGVVAVECPDCHKKAFYKQGEPKAD